MRRIAGVLLFLLCSPLFAQVRIDLGAAAGLQPYEEPDIDPSSVVSAEATLSRGRFSLYYALDYSDLSSSGAMYASHLGVAYRWPLGHNVAFRAGAGPSYVTVEQLGGEPSWHAEAELSLRTKRVEWFAKVRQYDYTLDEFHIGRASPNGPAWLGGLRVALKQ
jgi:hypothetical protein